MKTFEQSIEVLANKIKASNKEYDCVVGVLRGGAVPAVYLAHALNLPLEMINWQTRDGFKKEVKESLLDKKCLFVDDICDSGKTIKELREVYNSIDIAVVYQRRTVSRADYFGEAIGKDWVVFPWEETKNCVLESA